MRARHGLLATLCCLPLLSSTISFAQTESGVDSLSLKQALQLTLQDNPQLKVYPYYVRQLEGEKLQADLIPAARAELEISEDEASLTFSQNFELGDKRKSRVGFTTAKQAQLQAEFEISQLDVLAETSRRYYQLLALQKQKTLLETRIGQEKRALKIINKRAKSGAISQADVATMALGLSRSRNTLEQLDFSIKLQQDALSAMWLDQQIKPIKLQGSLSQLPSLPDEEDFLQIIQQGIKDLPDYRYQVALARLADSSLSLAQANGHSNIKLGLGLRHNDSSGEQSLVLSGSMPLNFNNPNRGRIASAQAQQTLSLEQLELKRQQLSIELKRIKTQLEQELQLAKRISLQLLPLASELLSATQKAYRQGQYTVLQWIDAQNQVFKLEQDLINSQVRIFNQVLELERILGQSIIAQ
jgi:cobalt-zinc-cadmium efflux system outer membrane protein